MKKVYKVSIKATTWTYEKENDALRKAKSLLDTAPMGVTYWLENREESGGRG